jgi:hypothetical protein
MEGCEGETEILQDLQSLTPLNKYLAMNFISLMKKQAKQTPSLSVE